MDDDRNIREDPQADELRRSISETRAAISATLGDIEAMLGDLQRTVRGGTSQLRSAVADSVDPRRLVKRHPVVAVMGAIGLGLLAARHLSRRSGGDGPSVTDRASRFMHSGGRRVFDGILDEIIRAGRQVLVPALVARIMAGRPAESDNGRRLPTDGDSHNDVDSPIGTRYG